MLKDKRLAKIYGTYPSRPGDVPQVEHWAILTGSSVFIPGDERSRQAPGHGYPEHSENHLEYEAFEKFEDFEHEIERLTADGQKDFRAIHVLPVKVDVQVRVS